MGFLDDTYEYEYTGQDKEGSYVYTFDSIEKNTVTKIIRINHWVNISEYGGNWHNIGFSNKDKLAVNNVKDFQKVIATVFVCAVEFLKLNPDSKILFFGDAPHKQYWYKRGVGNNIEGLKDFLNVRGGVLTVKVPLKLEKQMVMKRGELVEREMEIKDLEAVIDIAKIKCLEEYNKENKNDYDFILIEIK